MRTLQGLWLASAAAHMSLLPSIRHSLPCCHGHVHTPATSQLLYVALLGFSNSDYIRVSCWLLRASNQGQKAVGPFGPCCGCHCSKLNAVNCRCWPARVQRSLRCRWSSCGLAAVR